MSKSKTTNWIEYGLIASLIAIAVVMAELLFGPELYQAFEGVRTSL